MNNCTISIDVPKKILKGAGINNSSFLPAWTYKIKIILHNNSNINKICSFTSTLGNGIKYIDNLTIDGPDKNIKNIINIISPNSTIQNNNVIIFANNFILSPNSQNIISFDIALFDKLTEHSIENSGHKISHGSNILFSAHLINDENVYSCTKKSKAYDFLMDLICEDENISIGEITKFYINCSAGQYDVIRSVYVRSILDEELEFVGDSCNMEPRNIYTFDNKTILKWDIGTLIPCETKKIGFKAKVTSLNGLEKTLKNKSNSNGINNETYTQCPCSSKYLLSVN